MDVLGCQRIQPDQRVFETPLIGLSPRAHLDILQEAPSEVTQISAANCPDRQPDLICAVAASLGAAT
jgi:hypothetical protein